MRIRGGWRRAVPTAAILVIVGSACGAPPVGSPTPTEAPSGGGSATIAPRAPTSPSAASTPAPIPTAAGVGRLAFTVDAAKTASIVVAADGTAAGLELVVGNRTWTLAIPAFAVQTATTVTLTSLSHLTAEGVPGKLTAGVAIGPDGLRFDIPATIRLTGAPSGSASAVLVGDVGGGHMAPAPAGDAPSDGSRVTGAGVVVVNESDGSGGDWATGITGQMGADEAAARKAADQQAADTDLHLPVPPSVSFDCQSGDAEKANAKAVSDFVAAVREPEAGLLATLLAARRERSQLGQPDAPSAEEAKLLDRLEAKAGVLLSTYGTKYEKLRAVATAVLSIASDLAALGRDSKLVEQLGPLFNAAVDPLLSDLVDNHDYRKAYTLLLLARTAASLGAADRGGELVKKLEAALTFNLEVTFDQTAPDSVWKVTSTTKVAFVGDQQAKGVFAQGNGKAKTTYDGGDVMTLVGDGTFLAIFTVRDVDPCAGTGTIVTSGLFPVPEQYLVPDVGRTIDAPMLLRGFTWAYRTYNIHNDGGYWFPVAVRNGDAVMADVTFKEVPVAARGKWVDNLHLVLRHTPQTAP